MKYLGIVLGGIVSIFFAALLAVGVASELGYLPSPDVLPANEVPESYLTTLKQSNIIEDNENVHFFYSAGIWSILEDGNLFTDERVISYERLEGQFNLYSATYNEIEQIDITRSDELWGTSEIKVTKKDGSWFILFVDNEHDKDVLFLDELKKLWGDKNA